jgi:hypothetical protein
MTDEEKAAWKSRMEAAKAAKAGKPPENPPAAPGKTSAASARQPQKTAREIALEKHNAVLEDRVSTLEAFVKSLGSTPPKARAKAPAVPAVPPTPPEKSSGWDWEGFANNPLPM